MTQYDNTNRGVLFKNDKKEKDTHSDYNGTINVDGQEYYLNAWLKEGSKSGKKFFSLSVKLKGERKMEHPAQSDFDNNLDDAIPF